MSLCLNGVRGSLSYSDLSDFGSAIGGQRLHLRPGCGGVKMLLLGQGMYRLGERVLFRGIKSRLMSELEQQRTLEAPDPTKPARTVGEPAIFGSKPEPTGGFPLAAWGVAALIVLIVVGALIYAGRKKPAAAPNTLLPADAYSASLPLSQFAMSESGNLSGGKLTYLDGHVSNTGSRTVTSITVQVVFGNDEAMAPQIDTLPLALIRTKEPYIDIEPVSADPLKPGDDREFRLTFEMVPENWNTQMPEVRVIHTDLR